MRTLSLAPSLLFVLIGCSKDDTGTDTGTDTAPDTDTDTDTTPENYLLEEGYYTVEVIETPANVCNADFSYMEGRDLRVWIEGNTLDIEGIVVERDANDLSGTETEQKDWSFIGADCVTDIAYTYTGEVLAEGRFQWDWEVTWSYASGDGCMEALGHELPCTYWGLYTMQYDRALDSDG